MTDGSRKSTTPDPLTGYVRWEVWVIMLHGGHWRLGLSVKLERGDIGNAGGTMVHGV